VRSCGVAVKQRGRRARWMASKDVGTSEDAAYASSLNAQMHARWSSPRAAQTRPAAKRKRTVASGAGNL
jgi:hypothetical protein